MNRKLISNYAFTAIYQVLVMLVPFLTIPYVSRVLGADGVGKEAYVTSIVQLFLIFSILSIPLYGSRQIATKKSIEDVAKEFWSIYTFQFLSSGFMLLIYAVFILFFFEDKSLYWINMFMFLAYASDISWYFIGREEIKKTVLRNTAVKLIGVLLIFMLVKNRNDLWLYILINTSTLFIGQLIMWIPLIKELGFGRKKIIDLKTHLKPILILFIPQVMIQVYILVNRVVLGNVSGEIEVGYYTQANKIIRLTLGIISSVSSVMMPRMASEFSGGNKESLKKYADYSLKFILFLTIPLTFGTIAITPNFVNWFFGPEFGAVSLVLMTMSPVIIVVGLANVFGVQILVSTNQQGKYSLAITIGAILSLIVNIMLVFSLKSLGTTIALLSAEVTGALISMYYARSYFNFSAHARLALKYGFLGAMMLIIIKWFDSFLLMHGVLQTFTDIAIGATIYLIALLAFKDPLLWLVIGKLKIGKKVSSKETKQVSKQSF
ncbi:oligosaccharide flippase family protein [Paenibacillus humicus]|uniref:oligosaccharide flippase family protein n=1 Tax=Paenibacillus humicus TaxID=412861 RepID=UPI000FD8C4BD|nr:oligosaccharide flippase family protein [Paenibacillus humicus]